MIAGCLQTLITYFMFKEQAIYKDEIYHYSEQQVNF
jgi:hypothetical protein